MSFYEDRRAEVVADIFTLQEQFGITEPAFAELVEELDEAIDNGDDIVAEHALDGIEHKFEEVEEIHDVSKADIRAAQE